MSLSEPAMHRPPPQSFLLRLWREHAGAPFRATLVPVGQPDAPRHFATVGELCVFLRELAGDEPEAAGAPNEAEQALTKG